MDAGATQTTGGTDQALRSTVTSGTGPPRAVRCGPKRLALVLLGIEDRMGFALTRGLATSGSRGWTLRRELEVTKTESKQPVNRHRRPAEGIRDTLHLPPQGDDETYDIGH
jgi:hypothetical protein